jgi:hypothetical protein
MAITNPFRSPSDLLFKEKKKLQYAAWRYFGRTSIVAMSKLGKLGNAIYDDAMTRQREGIQGNRHFYLCLGTRTTTTTTTNVIRHRARRTNGL